MKGSVVREIEAWEDEGGAALAPLETQLPLLTGSESQVEWAERIRRLVRADFDRVAAAFRSAALKQEGDQQVETESVIAILEAKRSEVLSRQEAGYFIHDWQEITDQVRQLIFHDDRYQAIRSNRAARLPSTNKTINPRERRRK